MRVLPYLFFLPRRQNLNKEGILNMATKVSRTKIVTSGKLNYATRQSIERYWKKFEEDGDHLSHTIEYDSKKDETTITMLPCVVLEEESYSVSGRSNQPTESYSRHIVIDGEMPTITGNGIGYDEFIQKYWMPIKKSVNKEVVLTINVDKAGKYHVIQGIKFSLYVDSRCKNVSAALKKSTDQLVETIRQIAEEALPAAMPAAGKLNKISQDIADRIEANGLAPDSLQNPR